MVFGCYEDIFESLYTPGIGTYIFRVRKNISDISLFGFRPYFEFCFPFLYKTKKNEVVFVLFKKRKFQIFSKISDFFRNFRLIVKFSVCGKLMKNLKFFSAAARGQDENSPEN